MPKSNSWLPRLVASSPHAFSTSIAGLSSSSAELGGEAPTLSPDANSTDWPGRRAASASNMRGQLPRATDGERGDRPSRVLRPRWWWWPRRAGRGSR